MGQEYDLAFTNRPPIPSAPTNVVATTGTSPGTVVLTWDASADATGYKVYYDDGFVYPPYEPFDDGVPQSGAGVGNVVKVQISGLAPGEWYYFAVKAYNANGSSEYSETVSGLSASSTVGDDDYEQNDKQIYAWYPGGPWPGIPLSSISGEAIQADADWYRLDLQPVGYEHLTVTTAFQRVEGDITMDLFDSDNNHIASSVGARDFYFDYEIIDVICSEPGDYYLLVWGDHAGNSYDLKWFNEWVDTPPQIEVSPAGYEFGRLEAGQGSNTIFNIRNVGGGTLAGTATISSPFSILSNNTFSLVHSQSQDFTVQFYAGAIGTFTNNLVFSGMYGTNCIVTGQSGAPQPYISNYMILPPNEAVIEWDGVQGAQYYIYSCTDLVSGAWTVWQSGIDGAKFNSETSKVPSSASMFYRIGVD